MLITKTFSVLPTDSFMFTTFDRTSYHFIHPKNLKINMAKAKKRNVVMIQTKNLIKLTRTSRKAIIFSHSFGLASRLNQNICNKLKFLCL